MALQINSTKDVGNNGVKLLVYGKSGVGKTRLASTAVSPFVISAESGLLSLQQYNIPYVVVKTIEDVYEAYNMVLTGSAKQFNDIFLDSISEIMEVLLAKLKADPKLKDIRQAYGGLADKGVDIAKAFRDLPGRNVCVLAKEEYVKDDATGITSYQPSLPGSKLGPALPYYFDEVLRYEIGINTQTVPPTAWEALRCKATFNATAKDRSGRLAEYEQANFGALTRKILGR
jgi:hypothetical protein